MDLVESSLEIRATETKDAAAIWQLVCDSGVLDVNSAYLYLLLCRDFCDTCLVACRDGVVIGFVSGYRLPTDPRVLFVWQIGVAEEAKRQGIASRLLRELVQRCNPEAIEATVAPSNTGSRRLFERVAQTLDAPLVDLPQDGFRTRDFPTDDHEDEPRIRIGPLGE